MLTRHDQVYIAFKIVTDDDGVDAVRVGEFIELLVQFLRLAVAIMSLAFVVINTLNSWADAFWDAWDAAMIGLRWHLAPVRTLPGMG